MSLATCSAHAGFVVTDQFRLYGVGVSQGSQTTINYQDQGYYRDSLIRSGAGATAKLNHESLIDDDAYKSTNSMSLYGTPRVENSGGLAFSVADLYVESSTMVRISFDVEIVEGIDSYHSFVLENTSISETIYMLEARESMSGSVLLTLEPGNYNLADSTINAIREPNISGYWSIRSVVSMIVVPTPSTLALLTPAALFATRRRR